MSARQRLLQPPSMYGAKLPRQMEEQNVQSSPDETPGSGRYHTPPPPTQLVSRRNWRNEPVSVPAPATTSAPAPQHKVHGHSRVKTPTYVAPATQLVDRKLPGKRKQPDAGPPTQRQTRSQTKKNQAKAAEFPETTGACAAPGTQLVHKTEPVSPRHKKLKATPVNQRAGNTAKCSGASQAAGRNTKNTKTQCKIEEPSAHETVPAKSTSITTRSKKAKASTARKKGQNPAKHLPVNTNPLLQKRLIVSVRLGQRAQGGINVPPQQISANHSYRDDELGLR